MKALRIGFFIQHFPPYLGGAELQARILAETLASEGHTVEVATTRFTAALEPRSTSGKLTIWRLPTAAARWLKLPVNMLMGLFAGWRIARRVDIFHAHCLSPFCFGAMVAGKLTGRPILIKICSVGPDGDIARIRGFGPGTLLWRAFRHCDQFVAGTTAAVAEIVDNGVEVDRVSLIPSLFVHEKEQTQPIDRVEARRQLCLPERTTLLYVGRLAEGKGISAIMELWPGLSDRFELTLALVGDGPMRAELEAWRSRFALEESVILAGYQPDPGPWYRAADIFVFPSRSESFGNAIVEAMSHGLAMVCSRVGAIQDWPDSAPLNLIDISQPEEMDRILAELIQDNEKRASQGSRAQEFISERYGVKFVMNEYLVQYRQLLADGNSAESN